MADTYNEEVLDAMVRHQIGLLRFSGHLRNQIWELLDATEADMRSQIANILRRGDPGQITPANIRRMERLLISLRETRADAWEEVTILMLDEMRAFAIAEPAFVANILTTVIPVELGLSVPTADKLKSIVTSHPFEGAVLKDHMANLAAVDIKRIDAQVKIGLVQGETPAQISRRVVGTVSLGGRNGVTQITRKQVDAIVRTAISGIGSQARREFAEVNKDIAPEEVFVATLDGRTTPICRSLDGDLFAVGTGPVLPLHFGERSIYSPVIDGEVIGERPIRNFTQRQLVREYADAQGLGNVVGDARKNLPFGHKGTFDAFARQRMRELTGTVPAKTTYTDFLNRQSVAVQNDILGVTRGKLFRTGGLDLDKFVDRTGAEIPLSELAKMEAAAFKSAGLDPKAFVA